MGIQEAPLQAIRLAKAIHPAKAIHLAKATWPHTWPINQILGRLRRAHTSDRQELGQMAATEQSQQSSARKG